MDRKHAALADHAFDRDSALMRLDDVFDNRKSQPGAAERPTAGFIPPLEAMQRGLPIVAYDTPIAREICGDGGMVRQSESRGSLCRGYCGGVRQ